VPAELAPAVTRVPPSGPARAAGRSTGARPAAASRPAPAARGRRSLAGAARRRLTSPAWPGRGVTRSPGGPHTGDDVAAHAGEVRVNVGGEPDRDDFGLPPVDIEIPDDARELDRDVQAYRRELRALRRQKRMGRLHAPLTRNGLVLPLLAGCLAMVLISGVLLTLFSASQSGTPQLSASARPTQSASISQPTSQLPNAKVVTASGRYGCARCSLPCSPWCRTLSLPRCAAAPGEMRRPRQASACTSWDHRGHDASPAARRRRPAAGVAGR